MPYQTIDPGIDLGYRPDEFWRARLPCVFAGVENYYSRFPIACTACKGPPSRPPEHRPAPHVDSRIGVALRAVEPVR